MLNEEEKKAIEFLNEQLDKEENDDFCPVCLHNYLVIILDLVKRLKKETDREKQYSDFYEDLCNTQREVIEENKLEICSLKNKIFGYKRLYISKDKIRELIINKAYKDSYKFKTISIEDLEKLLEEN